MGDNIFGGRDNIFEVWPFFLPEFPPIMHGGMAGRKFERRIMKVVNKQTKKIHGQSGFLRKHVRR